MKVTLIQMDIEWQQRSKNLQTASRLMDDVPGSELYILPEMFSTGFVTDPDGMVDECDEELKWMKQQAHQRDAAICGSVATKAEDGTFRNRLYFVKPDGSVSLYDKHHLFTYGGEDKTYTAGQQRTIIEWHGFRILPLVCYDLRFPVWSRNLPSTKDGSYYDVCIYVASWPSSRQDAWQTLLRARAIENQCYVLGINRIGNDPNCTYQGGTQIIDAYGRIFVSCPDNEQSTITATLDMERLQRFRTKFPVLNDADKYSF